MTDIDLSDSFFHSVSVKESWSMIHSAPLDKHSYVLLHEYKGVRTGRQILAQVRRCSELSKHLPVSEKLSREYWIIEYVPMMTDSKTVLTSKGKLESEDDLKSAQRYVFGRQYGTF